MLVEQQRARAQKGKIDSQASQTSAAHAGIVMDLCCVRACVRACVYVCVCEWVAMGVCVCVYVYWRYKTPATRRQMQSDVHGTNHMRKARQMRRIFASFQE